MNGNGNYPDGERQKVLITGIGVWSCFGRGVARLSAALRDGTPGRRPVSFQRMLMQRSGLRTTEACSLDDDSFLRLQEDDPTIVAALGKIVGCDALSDAGLEESEIRANTCGLIFGTTIGGGFAYHSHYRARHGISPGRLQDIVGACTPASIGGLIADELGFYGPSSAISTACAAGTNAIGRAADLIRSGRADIMLAGGLDLFSDLSFSGFNSLKALAVGGSKPFEDERDGLTLGDAGVLLVLESEHRATMRGIRSYAEVAGYGILNEAYHPTGPDPSGLPAARVMIQALNDANMSPDDVDYVNAHGTGTVANDAMEANALREVFGTRLPQVRVSATKWATGHTLGAAGALEAAITAIAVKEQFVPTTSPSQRRSQQFADLNIVRGKPSTHVIDVALSNSFGFGGNLASIAFAR